MKKFLSMLAVVFTVGLSTVAMEAEAAKRMGSGKSMGTQRQMTQDKAPTAPAQSAAAAPAAGGAAAAATPSRSWMGPVAGLAAGLGLAALASHFGFGDELASMVMLGLLAAAIMVAVGFFLRKRAAAQAAGPRAPAGMQYAHVNPGAARTSDRPLESAPSYKVLMPAASGSQQGVRIGSGIGSGLSNAHLLPAGFDAEGFERNAKVNFIRLQAANDAGNLEDIRQFTTPEMFAELSLELGQREGSPQKTEVRSIHAEVLEVDENAHRYVVSVRFTGVIRDVDLAEDESFDEVWHLTKPRQGDSGWVLGGIQQMS